MNKKVKSLILGAAMIMALPIIGGCGGGNNIGYVDASKIMTQTSKSIEINKEINAKGKELQAKIDAADADTKVQVITDAKQDFEAFNAAKSQELKQYIDQQVNELAKEKKLDVVLLKGAVIGGGVDVTDDLINKMGKASAEDIKAAEAEVNAQEVQQAQPAETTAQ